MTELTRSLLAAAREGLAPDDATAARVRAKVAAAVGTSAVTLAIAPAPARASSAALVKVGVAALAVATVAAVVLAVRSVQPPPVAPLAIAAASGSDDVRAEVRVVARDTPSTAVAREPDSSPRPKRPGAVPSALATSDDTPLPLEPASLSREVELMDLAMLSLRNRAPRAALEAIRVFEQETQGQGQMAEEAAAISIEARCTLHEDVSTALAAFDRAWPESAQRERIQTGCFGKHR